VQFKDPDKTLLRQAIARQDLKDIITHLRRYVPFRLIIPFLAADLGAVSRGKNFFNRLGHGQVLGLGECSPRSLTQKFIQSIASPPL
jgi:hypothetical protein